MWHSIHLPAGKSLLSVTSLSSVTPASLSNELSKHINTSTSCCTKTWMSPILRKENLYRGTLSASLSPPWGCRNLCSTEATQKWWQHQNSRGWGLLRADQGTGVGLGWGLASEMKAWLMFPGQFHSPWLPAERQRESQKEKGQLWTVHVQRNPKGSDPESPEDQRVCSNWE